MIILKHHKFELLLLFLLLKIPLLEMLEMTRPWQIFLLKPSLYTSINTKFQQLNSFVFYHSETNNTILNSLKPPLHLEAECRVREDESVLLKAHSAHMNMQMHSSSCVFLTAISVLCWPNFTPHIAFCHLKGEVMATQSDKQPFP